MALASADDHQRLDRVGPVVHARERTEELGNISRARSLLIAWGLLMACVLGLGREGEQQAGLSQSNYRLPSSVAARPTLMRLEASQLRISQLSGAPILWTRA